MTNAEYMTADGLVKLKEQLADLERQLAELRHHKGAEAIHAGDMWHDNPTFREVESQERALMRSMIDVKKRIESAQIIELPRAVTAVAVGCEVEVKFSDGAIERYKILGHADSNPAAGVLSYKSPLGAALLGKGVGAAATYTVGGQSERVRILSIAALGGAAE
jgi:transcription elongation GreA/GreB family factor